MCPAFPNNMSFSAQIKPISFQSDRSMQAESSISAMLFDQWFLSSVRMRFQIPALQRDGASTKLTWNVLHVPSFPAGVLFEAYSTKCFRVHRPWSSKKIRGERGQEENNEASKYKV
jgi:hypothetical protein